MQKELLLRTNPPKYSREVIIRIRNWREALSECKTHSGLSDKQINMELEVDPGQWSRIWSGQAHFPTDKLELFMELCGNLIPLEWLAYRFGHETRPTKSTLELQVENLEREPKEEKTKNIIISEWEGKRVNQKRVKSASKNLPPTTRENGRSN